MTPAPRGRLASSLISRDYATLWLGQSVSNVGDFVFSTTLVLWIATRIGAGQPWAPAAVSGVLFAVSLPTLFIGPAAGVFVDRWNQRKIMLVMDSTRAVVIFLLIPLTGLMPLPVAGSIHPPVFWILGIIYVAVALETSCAQFFNPSRTTVIRDIVDEPQRQRAAALSQTTANLALVLGPVLAAFLVSAFGIAQALVADSLSFLVSFLAVASIRWTTLPRAADALPPNFRREMWEGFQAFFTNRILRALLISMLIVMLGGGALNALDVFFVIQNLHVAAPQLGTISAVYGAGAVLGALLLAGLSQRIQPAVVFWLSLAGLGVTFVVYSRLSAFVAALAVMFIAGFPQAGLSIGLGPIIMKVTPREVLGRVSSIFGPAINLMAMISAGIAGLLDSTILRNLDLRVAGMEFRAVDSIFLCSGLLMLLGGLYARHNLKAVHMDTEEPGADSRQIS